MHRDSGDFRHPGRGKTGLEQGLDLEALGCIVHNGILLLSERGLRTAPV